MPGAPISQFWAGWRWYLLPMPPLTVRMKGVRE